MNLEHLIRVKSLTKHLWDDNADNWHSEENWKSILAARCPEEEALWDQVCNFVRCSQREGSELKMELLLPLDEPIFADPEVISRYKIVRRIGSGGMGIVYEARQQVEDGELPVALKLIKIGFDTEMFIRRFRTERLILARLQHKNIVKILDAGSTSSGRPYFVMELVDGIAIDDYCVQNRLPISARLELFRKVCEAVHFAHSQTIIHRDLKPLNILVDQHGDPKLLDFGLAKLLTENGIPSFAKSIVVPIRMGTDGFTAPEVMDGEAASVSSDIFSLGVILRMMLELPDLPGLSGPAAEVIAKATQKNPRDRYSSVRNLSLAVENVLLSGEVTQDRSEKSSRSHIKRNIVAASLVVGLLLWTGYVRWTHVANVSTTNLSSPVKPANPPSPIPETPRAPSEMPAITKSSPQPDRKNGTRRFEIKTVGPTGISHERPGRTPEVTAILKALKEENDAQQICEQRINQGISALVGLEYGDTGTPSASTPPEKTEQILRQLAAAGDTKARGILIFVYINFRQGIIEARKLGQTELVKRGACVESMFPMAKAEEAVSWLDAAAKSGNNESAVYLAMIFRAGTGGIHINRWESFRLSKQAADADSPIGHYYLGVCYWDGWGVPRDAALAVREWNKSASMDEIYSQYRLSELYDSGEARPYIPKDLVLAYMWSNIASSNRQRFLTPGETDTDGFTDKLRAKAAALRDKIRPLLTDEQLGIAEKQSTQWSVEHQPGSPTSSKSRDSTASSKE